MQNALVVPRAVRPGPPVSPLELARLVSAVASQPARRWDEFVSLLASPRLPSGLREPGR